MQGVRCGSKVRSDGWFDLRPHARAGGASVEISEGMAPSEMKKTELASPPDCACICAGCTGVQGAAFAFVVVVWCTRVVLARWIRFEHGLKPLLLLLLLLLTWIRFEHGLTLVSSK